MNCYILVSNRNATQPPVRCVTSVYSHQRCVYSLSRCAAPGSPRQHRSLSSLVPTKTRSTSSRQARRSALLNSPVPCTSPRLRSPRRTTQRRAPARGLRGPHHCTAPPLRSPPAPAQTTLQRSPAHLPTPQRLQPPRQTARPSARCEQSWSLPRDSC